MAERKYTIKDLLERIQALEKKVKELEEAQLALAKSVGPAVRNSMVF